MRRAILTIAAVILAAGTICGVARAKTIHVDADAAGTNNGTSWADAYKFLQDALADANSSEKPVEIRVAQGIYKPDQGTGITPRDRTATFQLISGVALKGAYAGFGEPDPDARDVEDHKTVLSGDLQGNDADISDAAQLLEHPSRSENSYHVVSASKTEQTATLDGFTVTGGNANAPYPPASNWPLVDGGAVYVLWGDPLINNCIFTANSARRHGGALYLWLSNSLVSNCMFRKNWGDTGGAISQGREAPVLRNCVFVDNVAEWWGGAIYCHNLCAPTITGSTFTRNTSRLQGGAITSESENTTQVLGCIFWDNLPAQIVAPVVVSYSNVQGGWPGTGNMDTDPVLAADGYHLAPASPCINAGMPGYVPAAGESDIDGELRVLLGRMDMGADEFGPSDRPRIYVSLGRVGFSMVDGIPTPTEHIILIQNGGLEELAWTIRHECSWLEVTPTFGHGVLGESSELAITLTPDASVLRGGIYDCEIEVCDPNAVNSPQYISVRLTVRGPVIAVSPSGVDFVYGEDDLNSKSQMVSVCNDDVGTLNWTMTWDCAWLSVNPTTGSSSGEVDNVIFSVDPSGLDLGLHTCTVTISDPNSVNSPQVVSVTLDVREYIAHVPREFLTIQEAVDYVPDGGIVIVAEGTYAGEGNYNIDFKGKAITVRSTDPNEPNIVAGTVIDCNEMGRAFYFHSGEDANSVLAGLSIANGSAGSGGGIYCYQSSPVITKCTFRENWARLYGGGMYNQKGTPTLLDCVFTGNSVSLSTGRDVSYGGGMYNRESNATLINCTFIGNFAQDSGGGMYNAGPGIPTLENCTFIANTAPSGGGIVNSGSTAVLKRCTFIENVAGNGGGISNGGGMPSLSNCTFERNSGASGGAIYNSQSSPIVENCRFTGNSGDNGAGLYDNESHPTLQNCVFSGNTASAFGGGTYERRSSAILENCTFSGSSSGGDGAAMFNDGSNTSVMNCTFTGNSGGGSGSTIYCASGSMSFANCVLWQNKVPDGKLIFLFDQPRTTTACSVSYTDIQGGKTRVYVVPNAVLTWGTGNIDDDPRFFDPGRWEDPCNTPENVWDDVWIDGDYHLKSQAGRWAPNEGLWAIDDVTSPCIDAGDPLSPIGYEPFPNGGIINMGAYGGTAEASKSYFGEPLCETIVAGDVNGDCKVNFLDFRLMALHWLEDR